MPNSDLWMAAQEIDRLCKMCHEANKKWWYDPVTGKRLERNKSELLMLVVTGLAEACEGLRKNLMDDKLPHRKMFHVELIDGLIRIFDLLGSEDSDAGGAFAEKMEFNATRKDHTYEERMKENGKKF